VKIIGMLVEGFTEISFVKNVLAPYLPKEIILKPIKTDGSIKYSDYKKQLLNMLNNHKNYDAVTTMHDLYALGKDFPGYAEAQQIKDPYQKVAFLENSLAEDLSFTHFIPHLQLHEFETLLFSDIQGFQNHYHNHKKSGLIEITKIFDNYSNPELINESYETAPSRRITKIFGERVYKKPLDGILIAQQIGIGIMLEKCSHFKTWVEKLVSV